MNLAAVIVVGLAVARLWRLAAIDDLPWLVKLRDRATGTTTFQVPGGAAAQKHERPVLRHWLECPWCAGLWLAVAGIALYRYAPTGVVYWIVGVLAVSEVVGLIVRNLDPTED